MNITSKLSANAWSDYLAARRNAIITFREEGLSFGQIAQTLNLADGAHAERIWSARDVSAAPNRKQQPGDKTWAMWIASAIGCHLQMDVDDKRLEAMAGIIERRLWGLQKDSEQVGQVEAPKSFEQALDELHNMLYSAQIFSENHPERANDCIGKARVILSKLRAAKTQPAEPEDQKPNRWGEEGVDLVARGMSWNDTEALMKEACAQAGIKWGENDQPTGLAINVMQRLANMAHKAGFTLAIERAAEVATGLLIARTVGVTKTPKFHGKVERHSDQSVLVSFGSCHEASVFERQVKVRDERHPIDMVLHCPKCGLQHIDEPEEERSEDICEGPEVVDTVTIGWDNPPHRSHLCHGCGHIWRPADVPTNGVQMVKTKGKVDSPIAAPKTTMTGNDLGNLIACFDAAFNEGLNEALAETTDVRLKDLVERRLLVGYTEAIGPTITKQP